MFRERLVPLVVPRKAVPDPHELFCFVFFCLSLRREVRFDQVDLSQRPDLNKKTLADVP